jgi:hypothetical protein
VIRSSVMLRRIGYRAALTAFTFTALWLFLGLLLLATPVPHALGIGGELFVAWVLIFLLALGCSGLLLFVAALNGLFPQNVRAPRSAERLWAATAHLPSASLPSRPPSRRRASGHGR